VRAQIMELEARFEVQPGLRADGTTGPPYWVSISVRPCWRKPAVKLDLRYLYEVENVVYYSITERHSV
jgi:hypothetical protein